MRVFLDFEASSLSDDSYPIEAGWVFEDGREETHLIRPAPAWTEWDEEAADLHGITRAELEARGTPHDVLAHRMLEHLGEHRIYATAPSWDGKWLSVLLRGAGLPRHALRLQDSDEAHMDAALKALAGLPEPEPLALMLIEEARARVFAAPARHRALEDAKAELAVFVEVQRLARARAG
jgi:hypothetical protein